MTEGPLYFISKGIVITVETPNKWELSGFSIDNEISGRRIRLPLLNEDILFIVHRDIFQQKEWEVFLQDWE